MTESRACPECGAEVPTGRFSCGACGTLLASVEGRAGAEVPADQRPSTTRDASAPAGPLVRSDLPVPAPPEVPATVDPPPPPSATFDGVAPPPPPMPPIPGAYLPPSTVARSGPLTAPPQPPPTPASRSAPPVPFAPAPMAPPLRGPEPGEATPGLAARVPVLELPFAIAPGVGPRLVAVGAALAVIAFVLPWIPGGGVVIGGSFGSGYFATWGLAAVGNVPPFLLAWVGLFLAVLPNRVPRTAALGLLPVFLGGLLAGFSWTYLIGPDGIGIGIWALAGGAVLLAAGGWLVLRGGRAAG